MHRAHRAREHIPLHTYTPPQHSTTLVHAHTLPVHAQPSPAPPWLTWHLVPVTVVSVLTQAQGTWLCQGDRGTKRAQTWGAPRGKPKVPPCWGLPQAGSARGTRTGCRGNPWAGFWHQENGHGQQEWAQRVCVREEGKKCCLCRCALSGRCVPELVCDAGCAAAACVRAHPRVHVCARASPPPTHVPLRVALCLQVRSVHTRWCHAACATPRVCSLSARVHKPACGKK